MKNKNKEQENIKSDFVQECERELTNVNGRYNMYDLRKYTKNFLKKFYIEILKEKNDTEVLLYSKKYKSNKKIKKIVKDMNIKSKYTYIDKIEKISPPISKYRDIKVRKKEISSRILMDKLMQKEIKRMKKIIKKQGYSYYYSDNLIHKQVSVLLGFNEEETKKPRRKRVMEFDIRFDIPYFAFVSFIKNMEYRVESRK